MTIDQNPISASCTPPRKHLTGKQIGFRTAAIAATAGLLVTANILAPEDSRLAATHAYAAWDATAHPLAGERLAAASDACIATLDFAGLGHIGRFADGAEITEIPDDMDESYYYGPSDELQWQPLTVSPVLAEQRGDWALLAFEQGNQSGECLLFFPGVTPLAVTFFNRLGEGSYPDFVGSTGGGFAMGEDSIFADMSDFDFLPNIYTIVNQDTIPAANAALAFRGVDGYLPQTGAFTTLSGRVGENVVGMVIHTAAGIDIAATIVGDQFFAFWPDSFALAAPEMPEPPGLPWETDTDFDVSILDNYDGESIFGEWLELMETWHELRLSAFVYNVTLTLADGTELTDQHLEFDLAPWSFSESELAE